MSDGRTTVSDSETVEWTSASMMKEYSPVTISAAAQNMVSLTEIIGKIRESGVDLEMSLVKNTFTVEFSKPIAFASLKTTGNPEDVILKAFDISNNLVDLDVGSSEFYAFGEGIVKLELLGNNGQVLELSFLPQE